MAYKEFLIDKRIVQRHIDKGVVDSKQYDKHLSALPDRAENAATAGVEPEIDDTDESEDGDEG